MKKRGFPLQHAMLAVSLAAAMVWAWRSYLHTSMARFPTRAARAFHPQLSPDIQNLMSSFLRISKNFLCGLGLLAPALSPYTRISPHQPHKGPCDVPFGSTVITRCDKGFFCPPASIKGHDFAQQLGLVTLHIAQRLCLEHVFTMPRSVALPSRKRSVTACRVSPALGVLHSSAPRTGWRPDMQRVAISYICYHIRMKKSTVFLKNNKKIFCGHDGNFFTLCKLFPLIMETFLQGS